MKLDLNFNNPDFHFNSTSFFESRERYAIECTTTVYSFGELVLQAREIQHGYLLGEGRYFYNFQYVNDFFDSFMKGLGPLQSWENVDGAVHNLCVVQVRILMDSVRLRLA